MATDNKKIIQFRYFGEKNGLNYPSTITKSQLISGSIFRNYNQIIQLGIQAIPGTRIRINGNNDWIIVSSLGVYDLDLTNSSGIITELQFAESSLDIVNECDDAYLIIDVRYRG